MVQRTSIVTILHGTIQPNEGEPGAATPEDVERHAPLLMQRWFVDAEEAQRELRDLGMVAETVEWELV